MQPIQYDEFFQIISERKLTVTMGPHETKTGESWFIVEVTVFYPQEIKTAAIRETLEEAMVVMLQFLKRL